jgi:hypothetical protein
VVLNVIEEKLAMAFYRLLKMTLYAIALSHLILSLYKDFDNDYASTQYANNRAEKSHESIRVREMSGKQ